jgi:diguanylate cyclase (GGDEF)-like protein
MAPGALVGTNILDRLHPDELERAILQMTTDEQTGLSPGITRFRALHADGEYVPVEIFAADVGDGAEDLIGVYARSGVHQVFLEDVMAALLQGVTRHEALAPVCNTIQWHGMGSHLAIGWSESGRFHQVSTGLPDELGGGDGATGTPWAECRVSRAEVQASVAVLDQDRRRLANELGISSFWIAPVFWHDVEPPATVTIWTRSDGPSTDVHSYGMRIARNMVELILRWCDQVEELSQAARQDALTGLANRRSLYSSLHAATGRGAVLYCDLDRFKPINDEFGHAAGDELLRMAALRLEGCVRESDVVARLGGDEFAVLCVGAGPEEATEVAERIRVALLLPFAIEAGEVTIGVSIGVAVGADGLDEELLSRADAALGEAKASGRANVKVAKDLPG